VREEDGGGGALEGEAEGPGGGWTVGSRRLIRLSSRAWGSEDGRTTAWISRSRGLGCGGSEEDLGMGREK
jgi:hypothetical protein